jgi:alpha-glucosidase
MFAGAMDFTPGAMRNATQKTFAPIFARPMSQGTRCHQLAMYVVYESPLQMLCDSPTEYEKEPRIMEFLAAVPTVWDETRVLDARIARFLIVARRHGRKWYVGAMTDWTSRDISVPLAFLGKGKFVATSYEDGINSDRWADDYVRQQRTVGADDTLRIHLAPGGGTAIRIRTTN